MPYPKREIDELLVDYAEALRDGSIPAFLSSLSRQESQRMRCSTQFWEAAQMARALNSVSFGAKAATPDVGQFTSRVDVAIGSRLRKAGGAPRAKTRSRVSVHKTL